VCERLYRARRLPVIFKLTTETQLVDLDAVLAQRGYGREGDAIVQVLDLAAFNRLPQTEYVVIEPFASDAWVDEYFRLNSERGNYAPILKRMLGNLIHPAAFVRLSLNGHCAALGMGVLEDGVLGLLGVVVDAPLRGQGFGTELMLHLLAWGRARGATGAYLQVTRENTAARRLYTSLGFAEAYRYWYRAKP
jgi:GNAT superfamily N-acetyltransferase